MLHARTRRTLALAAGMLAFAPAGAMAQEVEGQYIVVLKGQASKAQGEVTKGKVRREGGRVHALGTRHSFTDLPDTDGTLIDVSGLTSRFDLDEDARTVTVSAGTRYGIVAKALDERGWALHNLGSLPHISVGGATATGTHGSGDRNGVLSTAVRGIRYVGADGELHEVRRGEADAKARTVGVISRLAA